MIVWRRAGNLPGFRAGHNIGRVREAPASGRQRSKNQTGAVWPGFSQEERSPMSDVRFILRVLERRKRCVKKSSLSLSGLLEGTRKVVGKIQGEKNKRKETTTRG